MTAPSAFRDGLPPDTPRSEWGQRFMLAVADLGPIRAHFSRLTGRWLLNQRSATMKAIVAAGGSARRDRRRRRRRRLGLDV